MGFLTDWDELREKIRPWLALVQSEGTKTEALAAGKIGGLECVDAAFEARIATSCACRGRPIAVALLRTTPCKRTPAPPPLRTANKRLGQAPLGATAQARIVPRGTRASTKCPQGSTHCGRRPSTWRGLVRIARERHVFVSPLRLPRPDVRPQRTGG